MRDLTPELAKTSRLAVFGGVYNNYLSLDATLAEAAEQGADQVICLGDLGGFGPFPDRSIERLRSAEVITIQGNYDDSVGNSLPDCQCGYSDPRDNHFARISYDYTLRNTNAENREWLRQLPAQAQANIWGLRLRFAHGSPRRVNEFLWESATPSPFIRRMLDETGTDVVFVTHTGLHWQRWLGDSQHHRGVVNVGAIGRPANNGDTRVWYALVDAPSEPGGTPEVTFRGVEYDYEKLAAEMRAEALPEEFVETILSGWWTTCLEILPAKERRISRY
ncbi:MAG: metallophosphoesterase family protein [Myxococcales bacterium]|nr:metallophosphoesterase family protein [Myxococcales bacterium]